MKNKEQQFINAYEEFLNDVPDTKTKKQDNKNDTYSLYCLTFNNLNYILYEK